MNLAVWLPPVFLFARLQFWRCVATAFSLSRRVRSLAQLVVSYKVRTWVYRIHSRLHGQKAEHQKMEAGMGNRFWFKNLGRAGSGYPFTPHPFMKNLDARGIAR